MAKDKQSNKQTTGKCGWGWGKVAPVHAVLRVFIEGGIKCSVELCAVRPGNAVYVVCVFCYVFPQDYCCTYLVASRKTLG